MAEQKKEIAVKKDTLPADTSTAEKAAFEWLRATGTKLTDSQAKLFVATCQAYRLNPVKKEIYAVAYGDKFNIIVGYETYIKRAEGTGLLKGWRAWIEGEGGEMKAVVEIKRADWDEPFRHEVYLSEYNSGQGLWKSKPKTMLKKVAIAQGFRLCFPNENGGLPYDSSEIDAPKEPVDITPEPAQIESKPVDFDALRKAEKTEEKIVIGAPVKDVPFKN